MNMPSSTEFQARLAGSSCRLSHDLDGLSERLERPRERLDSLRRSSEPPSVYFYPPSERLEWLSNDWDALRVHLDPPRDDLESPRHDLERLSDDLECLSDRFQRLTARCSTPSASKDSMFHGLFRLNETPNHALQRTGAAVTPAASAAAFPPTTQRSRQPRRSLSLGSLGRLAHLA